MFYFTKFRHFKLYLIYSRMAYRVDGPIVNTTMNIHESLTKLLQYVLKNYTFN